MYPPFTRTRPTRTRRAARSTAQVPDFPARVRFVAETRLKINALRDQQVEAASERTKAMWNAGASELLQLPSMRRCRSMAKYE